MNSISGISALDQLGKSGALQSSTKPGQKNAQNFKETLSGFLGEVNSLQNKSGEAKQKFMAGEITDVHQVMNASQEAKVSFNLLMEIRNKVMDGYKEIMRMRL